jgi:hypothetical protein
MDVYLNTHSFTHNRKAASERKEVYPSYMSLQKGIFEIISKAFRVPPSYLYLRANANASGTHAKYCQRDILGNITNIGE